MAADSASPLGNMKVNVRNPAIRRIMREVAEFQRERSDDFTAAPCEDNLFEWHFTIRGAGETEFEGGWYHGRILLPSDYPFKPPDIVMLTPSGRFSVNEKICLSISGFHPKNWQPSWSIRTVLIALIAFFPTPANGAIGSLEYSKDERIALVKKSGDWSCLLCKKKNREMLPEKAAGASAPSAAAAAAAVAAAIGEVKDNAAVGPASVAGVASASSALSQPLPPADLSLVRSVSDPTTTHTSAAPAEGADAAQYDARVHALNVHLNSLGSAPTASAAGASDAPAASPALQPVSPLPVPSPSFSAAAAVAPSPMQKPLPASAAAAAAGSDSSHADDAWTTPIANSITPSRANPALRRAPSTPSQTQRQSPSLTRQPSTGRTTIPATSPLVAGVSAPRAQANVSSPAASPTQSAASPPATQSQRSEPAPAASPITPAASPQVAIAPSPAIASPISRPVVAAVATSPMHLPTPAPTVNFPSPAIAPAASPVVVAAPAPAVRAAPAPPGGPLPPARRRRDGSDRLSLLTVLLTLAILAILLKKLMAHVAREHGFDPFGLAANCNPTGPAAGCAAK